MSDNTKTVTITLDRNAAAALFFKYEHEFDKSGSLDWEYHALWEALGETIHWTDEGDDD
jgi:uncharacterized SAM-dependent methyltransferase